MIKGMKGVVGLLLAISLFGCAVGYVLTNSVDFGICIANEYATDAGCLNFYERIGDPMFYGFGALAFVFMGLLFVPEAFSRWWKFAVWFVPLAVLLFIFTPEPQGWVSPIPSPESVFQWVSSFYVLASYSLIGLSLRKKS